MILLSFINISIKGRNRPLMLTRYIAYVIFQTTSAIMNMAHMESPNNDRIHSHLRLDLYNTPFRITTHLKGRTVRLRNQLAPPFLGVIQFELPCITLCSIKK